MSAEDLKNLFDANAVFVIFLFGLAAKYIPVLARFPNAAIPWVGAVGYILTRLATGTAIADDASTTEAAVGIGAITGLGFWQAVVASLLYERFCRPILEGIGIRKAVPKPAR